uniref:Uncharacterized protein n=1 Tax=Hot spring virus BHS2 TaxID=2024352 RepID=A0A2U7PC34_9VIRU|nr:hypothetical protein [Hot spring virus BHS2]
MFSLSAPNVLDAKLRVAHTQGYSPWKSSEELVDWFLEDAKRIELFGRQNPSQALAKSANIPEELARFILQDEGIYQAIIRRLFMHEFNPLRVAQMYRSIFESINSPDTRLMDKVAAWKFFEHQARTEVPTTLRAEFAHQHEHRHLHVVYGDRASERLRAVVADVEALPASEDKDSGV